MSKKKFTPKFLTAGIVSAELAKVKSGRGIIIALGNDIYVEDYPSDVAMMMLVFNRIDRVDSQLLIEARIIETTPSFIESLGIEWITRQTGVDIRENINISDGTSRGSHPSVLVFGLLDKADSLPLMARLTAFETTEEAKTVLASRIMSFNEQEVTIKKSPARDHCSGNETSDENDCRAYCLKYEKFYVDLEIKPSIDASGQVACFNVRLANYTKEAKTNFMLKDRETMVIRGVKPDGHFDSKAKGGYWMRLEDWLPINRSNEDPRPEILIFITANIIPVEN